MTPDRELDALIAEKVMGEPHRTLIDGLYYSPNPYADVLGNDEPDRYSTDIAAAWTAVDRLLAQGLSLNIRSACHGPKYVCTIGGNTGAADKLPEAICRAALLAVSQPSAASGAASPES